MHLTLNLGGWRIGGLCKGVELAQGGNVTDGAASSKFCLFDTNNLNIFQGTRPKTHDFISDWAPVLASFFLAVLRPFEAVVGRSQGGGRLPVWRPSSISQRLGVVRSYWSESPWIRSRNNQSRETVFLSVAPGLARQRCSVAATFDSIYQAAR